MSNQKHHCCKNCKFADWDGIIPKCNHPEFFQNRFERKYGYDCKLYIERK